MDRVFEAYRAYHEQGFIPIFVHDEFDTRVLVEACIAAGVRGIEYTLRRPDAREMIPWVRRNYPDLFLVVGSTMDDERIVKGMRRRFPQLMTIREIADMGADGFVSMLGWSQESIRKYSPTHLVIPTAQTVTEAFQQIGAGAHLVKFFGGQLDLVRTCRTAPAFDFCPAFVTGGMSSDRIPEAVKAGAVVVASGFDLILKGHPKTVPVDQVARAIRGYLEATRLARAEAWPAMSRAIGGDRQAWLDSLPHYHPF